MKHTLILNKNWVAINVTTVERAFILMCRDSARALCPVSYETFLIDRWIERSIERSDELTAEEVIRTPNIAIEVPEVVILSEYGGVPFTEVNWSRRNLYKRDSYTCQYCNTPGSPGDLTIDHIKPRSRGGRNGWTNCVTSCLSCNTFKADKPLRETGMKLIKEPKTPKWQPIAGMIPKEHPESWSKFLKHKI